MIKLAVSASVLVSLLCGPAVADPATTYRLELVVKTGAQQATHVLFVADHSCGELSHRSPRRESLWKVCARPTDGGRVQLEVERRTRDGADEARTQAVVVARPGARFEVLDTQLTVATVP